MHSAHLLVEDTDYMKIDHPVYKYRMLKAIPLQTWIARCPVQAEYFSLTPKGILTVNKKYCWDGASGPTFDTSDSMRGSLFHDVLYQMLREGQLLDGKYVPAEHDRLRKIADQIIYRLCRADGMPWIRAQLWYWGIRWKGGEHALPRYYSD